MRVVAETTESTILGDSLITGHTLLTLDYYVFSQDGRIKDLPTGTKLLNREILNIANNTESRKL